MLLQSVLKWAIASLVVISPLVIAILPTVSLKLSKTVLSGTTLMLKRFTASCVNRSELFRIYKPQDPISEIETQVTSSEVLLNHCDSFRGGVLPIEISKKSSARQRVRSALVVSTNLLRYIANTCCCKLSFTYLSIALASGEG